MKKTIQTAAQAVSQFHILADQPVYDPTKPAKAPDLRAIKFREDFILEEFIEGVEALTRSSSTTAQRAIKMLRDAKAKLNELQEHDLDIDLVEFADSLADIKYVTEGAALFYNMDLDAIFTEVHDKNLTRFPATIADLDATIAKAEAEGVEVTNFFNEDFQRHVVVRKDSGKVYKSATHTLPNIRPLLNLEEPIEADEPDFEEVV